VAIWLPNESFILMVNVVNVAAVAKDVSVPVRKVLVALKTAAATKMTGGEAKLGAENNVAEDAAPIPS
jgi:hypothetical protein